MNRTTSDRMRKTRSSRIEAPCGSSSQQTRSETGMEGGVVKVRRKRLTSCMSCNICKKLLIDATTIIECLHTFCRKCIYEWITDEEGNVCPVCKIYLGTAPLEKLRADHTLHDLRTKVFPLKKEELELTPSMPLPTKRRDGYLMKVSAQSGVIGRRRRTTGKKALVTETATDYLEISDSPETPVKTSKYGRQTKNPSAAELSKRQSLFKGKEYNVGPRDVTGSLASLCVEEPARRLKPLDGNKQACMNKSVPSNICDDEASVPKSRLRGYDLNLTVPEDEYDSPSEEPPPLKIKFQGPRKKRRAAMEVSNNTELASASCKYERGPNPIWFSLFAADDQKGYPPLPQISPCYLRIKDGNVPVSCVKKYVVKKLNLISEAEVEITIGDMPMDDDLQMHVLAEVWLETMSETGKIKTKVGNTGKDFMIMLFYGRQA